MPIERSDLALLAGALRLGPDQIVDARWVDNGPGWPALRVPDAACVLAVEPDFAALSGRKVGVVGAHPAGTDVAFEVRAFTDTGREDAVTGSLNAGIAQWLIGTGVAPRTYVAAQGTRLGRRGRVHVEQFGDDIWIGGDTVVGVSGSVHLG